MIKCVQVPCERDLCIFIYSRPKHLILADFGCGDAKLARSVPNKVHSFDLVALNNHVTICDMSKVTVICSFYANFIRLCLTSRLALLDRLLHAYDWLK